MANFAISSSDPYGEVISSLNYVLANLGSVAGIDTGNVLVANVQTGEITSNGTVVSYLYQYMDVQYANSSTGGSGFSSNSYNKSYYGLRNTANANPISFNPVDYVWYQVSGGFGTTKSLWYQTIGGRQVAFFAGNSAPQSSFIPVPDMPSANSTPLDLDTITSAQNNQIVNVNAYYQANATPSTPSGGTYNFTNFTLTPPSSWSANIPGFVANTSIYISSAAFVGNTNQTAAPPATGWTVPVVYSEQFQGNTGPAGTRGFVPMGYVITASDPSSFSNVDFTNAYQSSRTNSSPPIGLGFAPIQYDTAQFAYQNLFTGNTITVVKQYDGTGWQSVVGNVISGGLFVPGSINANTLNANQVYALTIASTNANVGNVQSNGFWLQSSTGDARFGGNVSIGDNLTVGQNAQIGSNLNVGSSAVIGNNLTVGSNAVIGTQLTVGANASIGSNLSIGTNLSVGTNASIGSSLIIGTNATIGNNAVIGGNLNVTGLITQGSLANAVVTTDTLANGNVTGVKIANGTITGNNIQVNSVNGNVIQGNTIYGNAIIAGTLTANAFVAGTITAANSIQSSNAIFGNNASPGYWLDSNTGNARFGGNLSVGNNLTVGNLITASALNASTVSTEVLIINSATQQIYVQDDPAVNQVQFVNGSTTDITSPYYLWPDNTRGFGVGGGATINPTTTGNVGGSGIQVVYTSYVTSLNYPAYNLVELWKSGGSSSYATTFRSVVAADSSPDVNNFLVIGDNGAVRMIKDTTLVTLSSNSSWTPSRPAITGTLYTGWLWIDNGGNPTPATDPTYFSWGQSGAIWTNYGSSYGLSYPPPSNITTYNTDLVNCVGNVTIQAGVAVGNGGQIYRSSTTMGSGAPNDINTIEASGTFADLYSVASDIGYVNNTSAANPIYFVAVGTGGTILVNYRTFSVTGTAVTRTIGTVNSTSGWSTAVSGTTNSLNSVTNNAFSVNRATAWTIVGDNGIVLTANSSPGGAPGAWSSRTSNTTNNLNGVAECNGATVAVGANGTIIYSTNGGITWTSPLSNPADGSGGFGTRSLYGVVGDTNTGRWVVTGEELIMYNDSNNLSGGWTVMYAGGASYNSQLTRLVYNGSWANVANVSQPPTQQQISNQQVISGSYVDYDYVAGVPVTYYLVLGNMAGDTVYTGGPSILVTEIKR